MGKLLCLEDVLKSGEVCICGRPRAIDQDKCFNCLPGDFNITAVGEGTAVAPCNLTRKSVNSTPTKRRR